MSETEKELKKKYIPKHVLEKWLLKNGWDRYNNSQRSVFVKSTTLDCKFRCAIELPSGLSFDDNCLYYDDDLFDIIAFWSDRGLDELMRELESSILNNEK
jgi:hypothetical protein